MSNLQTNIQNNFGGGVPAYRDFLLRTEGRANVLKYTLENREKYFEELEKHPIRSKYQPDKEAFKQALFSRKTDPTRDRKLQWLIATAKLNQSERFGVGLGEAYGKDQDKLDTQSELLYVQLQEHYHTRILAEVVDMFGLKMPMVPPTFMMRQMVKFFVAVPHDKTLIMVAASEMVGCNLFGAMRDEGIRLFADEPEVAARIESLYNEIFADEIGHVGFIAAKLGPVGKGIACWLSRNIVWKVIYSSTPELGILFGKKNLNESMKQPFDVQGFAAKFPHRSYAAAAIE